MIDGDNRLPVLLQTIKNASVVFAKAEKMGAEAAFDMGAALVEAKSLCPHGEWTDFLEQAGVTPRSAQRYMRVVKSGMDREYVTCIGFSAALEEIDEAQKLMPDGWQATLMLLRSESDPIVCMWWRVSQFEGSLLQVFVTDDKRHCKVNFFENMPIYLVAFILNLAFQRPEQYPVLRQENISFRERDRRLADFWSAGK